MRLTSSAWRACFRCVCPSFPFPRSYGGSAFSFSHLLQCIAPSSRAWLSSFPALLPLLGVFLWAPRTIPGLPIMPKRARSARPKQHSTPAAMIDYHYITPSMFPLGVPRALRTRRGDCVGWRWVPVPRCSDVRAHAFLVAAWRSSPLPCSSAFGPRRVQRPAFLASSQRRCSPRLRWLALPRISISFWSRPSSSHADVDPARPSRNP